MISDIGLIFFYHTQIDGLTGYEVSARELLSKAVHLAQYLQTIGIESGDAITVCSENRIEFCVTIHAILYIGATVAPVNISYTESMWIYLTIFSN